MPTAPATQSAAKEEFELLVRVIRPKLHSYCARMIGSAVDAEDVVQNALANAYYLLPTTGVANLEGWMFRIAHNKAIDHLRAAKSSPIEFVEEYPPRSEVSRTLDDEDIATLALSVFLQLTPMQRSCVILKDVIGYSLAEISTTLGVSVGAIKAALHRARDNLRELAKAVEADTPLTLDGPEMRLLAKYVECFNSRDFDAIRAMLAEDVRLDLVGRVRKQGAEVGRYFTEYSGQKDLLFTLGFVDRKPAVLVSDRTLPHRYLSFILVQWRKSRVCEIRDFHFARHVMADAEIVAANDCERL